MAELDTDDEKQPEEYTCKFHGRPMKKYGNFPLEVRYGYDSTALRFDAMATSYNFKGEGSCIIKSSTKGDKRVATLHVCFRVRGEQIIPPVIILPSDSPNTDDPWEMPPGLSKKEVEWKGNRGLEKTFYHPEARVLFQKNAWLDETTATQIFEWCLPIVEGELDKFQQLHPEWKNAMTLVQQDNLEAQNCMKIKELTFDKDVFIFNTPEDCTDVCAWLDFWPLRTLKNIIVQRFWDDFCSSPDRAKWFSSPVKEGGIKAFEWRILMTHWVMESWEEFCSRFPTQLFKTAQRVGFANCRCGCENDLIRIGKINNFKLGELGDPITEYTPEMAKNMADMEKLERFKKRQEKRKKRRERIALKRQQKMDKLKK